VGTRDRIIAHLAAIGEIADPAGMASTRLAEAVGYPGSSVAFAQLLSGMERDGLISREVRGKRTYRITLAPAGSAKRPAPGVGLADAARAAAANVGQSAPMTLFPSGIDYDELARRLLVQVIRRLNAAPADSDETLAVLLAENTRLRAQVSELRQALGTADEAGVSDELTAS
jgi:hypothetical protein